MAIYLKKFENHTQYETYINGSDAILPNVSICTTEGDVHYNPSTPPAPIETRVVAKFNITDTSSETLIAHNNYVSAIEIDGVEQAEVDDYYQFDTIGEHTVKYTFVDPTSIDGFGGCSDLISVTIPDSIISIGEQAFQSCTGLTSIVIPNSVTSIGDYAFQFCSSLTSIVIPNSVTSIGQSTFNGCTSLTSCTIGSGVTSIGNETFMDCSSLTSMVVPNNVTSIGYGAFWGCSNLTSVTIGSGVSEIGTCAFYACGSLDAASIAAIEAIDPNAFYCD